MGICLLLLTPTILAISTKKIVVATELLSHSHHTANPVTDGDLHYYHKYREGADHPRVPQEGDKGRHQISASTFQKRQKLRDQAWKLRRHGLDSEKESHNADLKLQHKVEVLEEKLKQLRKHFAGLFEKQNEIDSGLKVKINHEEKFREVYAQRASENSVEAQVEMNPESKHRKLDLAKWDTQQANHYAEKSANNLKALKQGEKRCDNLKHMEQTQVSDLEAKVMEARAKLVSGKSKSEERVEKLKAMEKKINEQIQEGKAVGLTVHSEKKKKLVAQKGKFTGLVPKGNGKKQGHINMEKLMKN